MKSDFAPSLLVLTMSLMLTNSALASGKPVSFSSDKGGAEILAAMRAAKPALKLVEPSKTIRTGQVHCSKGFDFGADQCTFFGFPPKPSRVENDAATTLQSKINEAKLSAFPDAALYETQVQDIECDEAANCEITVGLGGGAL